MLICYRRQINPEEENNQLLQTRLTIKKNTPNSETIKSQQICSKNKQKQILPVASNERIKKKNINNNKIQICHFYLFHLLANNLKNKRTQKEKFTKIRGLEKAKLLKSTDFEFFSLENMQNITKKKVFLKEILQSRKFSLQQVFSFFKKFLL